MKVQHLILLTHTIHTHTHNTHTQTHNTHSHTQYTLSHTIHTHTQYTLTTWKDIITHASKHMREIQEVTWGQGGHVTLRG